MGRRTTLGGNVLMYLYTGQDAPPPIGEYYPVGSFDERHQVLLHSTELTVNRSGTEIPVTHKLKKAYDDALMGRLTWTASNSGQISFSADAFQLLRGRMEARRKVRVLIAEVKDAAASILPERWARVYVGDALFRSLSESYPDQQAATYTVEIRGTGPLSRMTAWFDLFDATFDHTFEKTFQLQP